MIRIENADTRDILIPSPKRCLKKIEEILPETVRKRTIEGRRWLSNAISKMSKPVATVEDFVDQNNALTYVQENFQEVRDRVALHSLYYQLFLDLGVSYKKEDKDSHQEATQDVVRLVNLIQSVESAQNSNLDTFRKTLDELIPKLNE